MKKLFKFLFGVGCCLASAYIIVSSQSEEKIKIENSRDKFKNQYEMLLKWMQNNQGQKQLTEYFVLSQLNKIVIYGCGTLGQLFLNEIKDSSDVDVLYFIDKNAAGSENNGLSVIGLEDMDKINEADAVIITPISYYDEIEQDLLKAGLKTDIISLEDIVYLVS